MSYFVYINNQIINNIFKSIIVSLYILCSSYSSADNHTKNIKNIYKLLQDKKFEQSIEGLKILSSENNIKAQLLYSKILFAGDITPQDFENSYFWALSALLGGLKDANNIIEKLNNYLSEQQIENINKKLISFFEKKAFNKDKRALIQMAKFYENYSDPPDVINSYKWYNIAVAIGIKTAKNKRDEMLNELDEKDLLEAQTLSIKLFKKINN
ncbi:hypothetical protein OA087_00380 [bacterium]|nr:hypothetical protein [bacterium]